MTTEQLDRNPLLKKLSEFEAPCFTLRGAPNIGTPSHLLVFFLLAGRIQTAFLVCFDEIEAS